MAQIAQAKEPTDALLAKYSRTEGCYTDCFSADLPRQVTFEQFVTAFYTTWLFKLERLILKFAVKRPSTDAHAADLAKGARDSFAAWSVEDRTPNQILLCDLSGRTRSWLMIAPTPDGTRLYFGSAVVPVPNKSGETTLGTGFDALLGFHKLYSKHLLRAAAGKLR